MERERWKRAKPDPNTPHHPLRNAVFGAIGALAVGVPVSFTNSQITVAVVTASAAIVGYALSALWERIWNYAREPVIRLEARIRELEKNRPTVEPLAPLAPIHPALVVSLVPGAVHGVLAEQGNVKARRFQGNIYTTFAVRVTAHPSLERPVTVLRVKAVFTFDDGEMKTCDTDRIQWYDEGWHDSNLGNGLPVAYPGSTLHLTFFGSDRASRAIQGLDAEDAKFHRPRSAKLISLTVWDELKNQYELDEEVDFSVSSDDFF